MRMQILASFGALAAALILSLAPAPAAAQSCGPLDDPMSDKCARGNSGSLSLPSAPGPVSPVTGRPYPSGVQPAYGGVKACAMIDSESKRCIMNKVTPEEYESAMSSGIAAARSAMAIQSDVYARVYGTPGEAGPLGMLVPGLTGTGAAAGGPPVAAGGVAACIQRFVAALEALGQQVGQAQLMEAGRACGVR
jgi:hypothetical protein